VNAYLLARAATSACVVLTLAAARGQSALAVGGVLVLIAHTAIRGWQPTAKLVLATCAMAVPLLAIHTFLNPAFPAQTSDYLFAWRPSGFQYATGISLQMWLLFSFGAVWAGTPRRVAYSAIASARVPPAIALTAVQALVLVGILEQKIITIRTAQRSRGVPVNGNLIERAQSLVAVTVPLIVASLMDAHARGTLLADRGIGTKKLIPLATIPRPNWQEMVGAGLLIATSSAVALVDVYAH
jgi:energy-coupling factor transporter transmembrane protein EcfT